MALFSYKIKNTKGEIEKGTIEAVDKYKAIEALQSKGFTILSLKEATRELVPTAGFRRRLRTRLKIDDLASLATQLATLLDAGIPLLRSLEIVKEQAEVRSLRNALEAITRDVEAGERLSEAFAKHPKVFSPIWVNITATGETSGQLPFVLSQIAAYMQTSANLRRKVLSALIYPIILTGAAIVALVVFMTIVVPMFAQLYSYFEAELPILTRGIIKMSFILKRFILPIFLGMIILILILFKLKNTEKGRLFLDKMKIRVPLFSLLFYNLTLHRFSSGLSMLLKSGVPILYSLEVVAKATLNKVYEGVIMRARDKVKDGEPLAKALEPYGMEFPPFVINMVKVGEESGNLPDMLGHVASFYEEKVDTIITRLPYIIEPLILLTIGGIIGIIVVGMFLPIFGIATAVQM